VSHHWTVTHREYTEGAFSVHSTNNTRRTHYSAKHTRQTIPPLPHCNSSDGTSAEQTSVLLGGDLVAWGLKKRMDPPTGEMATRSPFAERSFGCLERCNGTPLLGLGEHTRTFDGRARNELSDNLPQWMASKLKFCAAKGAMCRQMPLWSSFCSTCGSRQPVYNE
jgi:hypothetical protein